MVDVFGRGKAHGGIFVRSVENQQVHPVQFVGQAADHSRREVRLYRRPLHGVALHTLFKSFAHFRHDEDEQHVVVAATYLMDVFDVVIASQVLVGVRKLGAEKTDNP